MEDDLLFVTIKNRNGIVFQAKCRSVTSYNKIGKFDILPSHANFITLIENEVVIVGESGEPTTVKVDNGVAQVKENEVTIFLGVRKSS